MILYTDDEMEDETISNDYGLKEYLAEEEAYTKFILNILKQQEDGKEE